MLIELTSYTSTKGAHQGNKPHLQVADTICMKNFPVRLCFGFVVNDKISIKCSVLLQVLETLFSVFS